jgi:tetratricopeptide (TPR) repeat protein
MLWRVMTGAIARARLSNLLPFLLVVLTAYTPANASPSTARVDPPARHLPPPEEIALPHERATFNELLSRLVTIHGQPREALSAMDAALSKLTEPTKLRGFIQLGRAELLMDLGEVPKATAAIEDSIRLLPGYSGPLIGAAMYFAYANQPAKAADYFLRAAQSDPATVRQVDDYEVNNLLRRLSVARDERRADANRMDREQAPKPLNPGPPRDRASLARGRRGGSPRAYPQVAGPSPQLLATYSQRVQAAVARR